MPASWDDAESMEFSGCDDAVAFAQFTSHRFEFAASRRAGAGGVRVPYEREGRGGQEALWRFMIRRLEGLTDRLPRALGSVGSRSARMAVKRVL